MATVSNKMFDFHLQTEKNISKNQVKPEKSFQKNDPSKSNFEEALKSVSEALNSSKEIKPEEGEKNMQKEQNNTSINQNTENGKKNESSFQEINKKIAEITQFVKKLKEIPTNKNKLIDVDNISFSLLTSNSLSKQELFSKLAKMSKSLEQTNKNQSGMEIAGREVKKENNILSQLLININQLKDLLTKDLNIYQNTILIDKYSNLDKNKNYKDKRIYDLKLEKGLEKNKGKLGEQKTTLLVENKLNEHLKTSEIKEKLNTQNMQNDKKEQTKEQKIQNPLNKKEDIKTGQKERIIPENFLNHKLDELTKDLKIENKISESNKVDLGKQIISQIGEKVNGFIGKNYSHITVELKPEALGTVKIVLDMKKDTIQGTVIVDNSQVKDIIKDNIEQIKSILQDSGVNLSKLDVSMGNHHGQNYFESAKDDQLQKIIAHQQKVNFFINQPEEYEKNIENFMPYEDSNFFIKA